MILVTYYSETGNTEKVATAIYDELMAQGHPAQLKRIDEITAAGLSGYELVFLGSACHSADLARPVKRMLEELAPSPGLKLAGFVTHATYPPEAGDRERELYEAWAGKCIDTFRQAARQKGLEFLGYFGCQGAPSAPIEAFIHSAIVTEASEWEAYLAEVRRHPDEHDLERARAFAREQLAKAGMMPG